MSIAFYAFVLGIGIWASIKSRKLENAQTGWQETLFLANRNISLFVGTFTMTGEKRFSFIVSFTNNENATKHYTMCFIIGGIEFHCFFHAQ